jgi:hypothetical protein
MAFSVLRILRSATLGNRPTGKSYGEPYVNLAENQFGVIGSGGGATDLLAVPIYSTAPTYTAGTPVNYGGKLYVALVTTTPGAFNAAQWGLVVALGQTIGGGGFGIAPYNLGNIPSFTVNPFLGNYQYGNNNAAITMTAPAVDCAVDILVTNVTGAGAISVSGFTVGTTGDPLTTTVGSKFILSVRRINAIATFVVKALQ